MLRELCGSMKVWCFTAPGERGALTRDGRGTNLPHRYGPWKRSCEIDLNGEGDDLAARRLIANQGFCLFLYLP
jgi:hypothetical protein